MKKDNERLRNQLIELKVKRMEREKKEREITEPPKRELKKDHRLIPGIPSLFADLVYHFMYEISFRFPKDK